MNEGSADISADFLLFEFWEGEQVIMLPKSMVPKHFDCAQLIVKKFWAHTPILCIVFTNCAYVYLRAKVLYTLEKIHKIEF